MRPIFKYHARDAKGIAQDGEIEALDQDDAIKKLQEQGLIVVSVKALGPEEKKPTEKPTAKPTEERKVNNPTQEKQQSKTKKCIFCLVEIPYDRKICEKCAYERKLAQEKQESGGSSSFAKAFLVVVALGFWIGTVVINFIPSSETETVFQQIGHILNITNGLLMGIFILLVGILCK